MNRYVRAATVALLMAGGLGSAGCAHKTGSGCGGAGCDGSGDGSRTSLGDKLRNAYDTSWPDRYNFAARQATIAPFAQQATNGHFLEQTIWNWHFEPGSEKLNTAGMEKLNSIARQTPAPDPKLYVQTARDLLLTQDNADKIVALREDLTAKRAASIQRYMATQPGVRVNYEVAVHDAPVPGIYAPFAAGSFRSQLRGYSGGLSGGAGGNPSVSGGTNLLTAPGGGGGGGGVGTGTGTGVGTGTGAGGPYE